MENKKDESPAWLGRLYEGLNWNSKTTSKEFAAMLEISDAYWRKIIKGERKLSAHHILVLAENFTDLDLNYVFRGEILIKNKSEIDKLRGQVDEILESIEELRKKQK